RLRSAHDHCADALTREKGCGIGQTRIDRDRDDVAALRSENVFDLHVRRSSFRLWPVWRLRCRAVSTKTVCVTEWHRCLPVPNGAMLRPHVRGDKTPDAERKNRTPRQSRANPCDFGFYYDSDAWRP